MLRRESEKTLVEWFWRMVLEWFPTRLGSQSLTEHVFAALIRLKFTVRFIT